MQTEYRRTTELPRNKKKKKNTKGKADVFKQEFNIMTRTVP